MQLEPVRDVFYLYLSAVWQCDTDHYLTQRIWDKKKALGSLSFVCSSEQWWILWPRFSGWMSIDGTLPAGQRRVHEIIFSCHISRTVAFYSSHSSHWMFITVQNVKTQSVSPRNHSTKSKTLPSLKASQVLSGTLASHHDAADQTSFKLPFTSGRWVGAGSSRRLFALRTTLAAEQTAPDTQPAYAHTLGASHSNA